MKLKLKKPKKSDQKTKSKNTELDAFRLAKWRKAVDQAEKLLKNIDGHQMKVAEIALSVCEITRGGRLPEGTYTLTRFASEVGVNFRTLSNWVGIKRGILDKLPSYEKANAKYADLVYISREVGQNPTAAKVKEVYQKHIEEDQFERKIRRYTQDLKNLSYNFEKNAAAFKASEEILKEILFYTRKITEAIKRDRPALTPEKSKARLRPRAAASKLIGPKVEEVVQ